MASIFDFFKRLFSRRPVPTRPPAMSFGSGEPVAEAPAESPDAVSEPEPAPEPEPEPSPPPEPEVEPPPEPAGTAEPGGVDEEVDEDAEEEEEPDDLPADDEFDDEDPLAPDPFVSPDTPAIEALSPDAVSQQRADALALALTGEHKVYLAEAAGPGTLAEALNLLAQQGKVEAEFRDDEAEGPYLLYRVVGDAADQP